jgi:hypothetical protein
MITMRKAGPRPRTGPRAPYDDVTSAVADESSRTPAGVPAIATYRWRRSARRAAEHLHAVAGMCCCWATTPPQPCPYAREQVAR